LEAALEDLVDLPRMYNPLRDSSLASCHADGNRHGWKRNFSWPRRGFLGAFQRTRSATREESGFSPAVKRG